MMTSNLGVFIALSFLLFNISGVVVTASYYFYFSKALIIFTNGNSTTIENRIDGLKQAKKPKKLSWKYFFIPAALVLMQAAVDVKRLMIEQLTGKMPIRVKYSRHKINSLVHLHLCGSGFSRVFRG